MKYLKQDYLRLLVIIIGFAAISSSCGENDDPPPFKELKLKELLYSNGMVFQKFFYDGDNPVRRVFYDQDGKIGQTQYLNYENDRLVSILIYDKDEVLTGIREYKYNNLGLVNEIWVNTSPSDLTLYLAGTFEYDAKGKQIRYNILNRNGDLSSYRKYEYIDKRNVKVSFYGREDNYGGVVFYEYDEAYNPYYKISPKRDHEWEKNLIRMHSPAAGEDGKLIMDLGSARVTVTMVNNSYKYNAHKFPIEVLRKSADPTVQDATTTFVYYD
jgi:hypothetical protein